MPRVEGRTYSRNASREPLLSSSAVIGAINHLLHFLAHSFQRGPHDVGCVRPVLRFQPPDGITLPQIRSL